MGWLISIGLLIASCFMGEAPSIDTIFMSAGLFAIAGSLPHIVKLAKKDE